jgi:hypothetical protein
MNFVPVADLKDRFKIGKQAEINRRKYLGIAPIKVDGVFVIDKEQLSTLDSLNQYLNSHPKAKMSDFVMESGGTTTVHSSPVQSSVMEATLIADNGDHSEIVLRDEDEYTDLVFLVETIARTIAPVNPISHWERLQWIVENEIIVSTSEIQQLLGAKPKGEVWSRGCFVFTKTGKLGNQSSWSVAKFVK